VDRRGVVEKTCSPNNDNILIAPGRGLGEDDDNGWSHVVGVMDLSWCHRSRRLRVIE